MHPTGMQQISKNKEAFRQPGPSGALPEVPAHPALCTPERIEHAAAAPQQPALTRGRQCRIQLHHERHLFAAIDARRVPRTLHPARRSAHTRQVLPMIGLAPVLLLPARAFERHQAHLGPHQVATVGGRTRHRTVLAGMAGGQTVGIVAIETHGRVFPAAAVQAQPQRDLARRARLQRGGIGLQQALKRRMAAATQRFQRPSHLPSMVYLPTIPGRVQAPGALAPARFVRLLRAMLFAAEAEVKWPLAM